MGIPEPKIQGIDAERNNIDEIETKPITYLVSMAKLLPCKAGKNISANPLEIMADISKACSPSNSQTTGHKTSPMISKTGVYFAINSPSKPTDKIEGTTRVDMTTPP